jgi:hypothetical protein
MNRVYNISGKQATCSTSDKTALTLISSANGRPAINEFGVGAAGTPADNALVYLLQRFTAVGTAGASVTPQARNPSDNWTPGATAGENHSSEPTYTSAAILFRIALNQKATLLWQALPGNELWLPATANNGIGVRASSPAYTSEFNANVAFVD